MKRLGLILIAVLFIGLSSCEKIKDLITFEHKNTATITLGVKTTPGVAEAESSVLSTDIAAQLEDKGFDDLSKVAAKIDKLSIKIVSPDGKTFGDLSWFEVYIHADGMEEKIAWSSDISEDEGSTITPEINKTLNLLSYLNSEEMKFIAKYNVRNPINEVYKLELSVTYKVGLD